VNVLPRWLRSYEREALPRDVSAGITVGVLLVPQGMAYASLANLPPITGLYAALAALVIYAFVGTSSHLSFGPVALVSLLTASAVGPLADGDPVRFALLAGALAVMVGVLHIVLGALRAGAIVDLIAHPVIVGFTAAAGIIIGLTQGRDLLGADIERSERAVTAIIALANGLLTTHPLTLTFGVVAIALLIGLQRVPSGVPPAIVVVALSITASVLFDLAGRGVSVVGEIPAGLPRLVIPLVPFEDLAMLAPLAAIIALISFAESISIGKSIAGRSRETLDANRELFASGAANVAAGFVGGFPVAGSFSRSFLMYASRASTAASGLVAALLVGLTLTLLTPLLEPLPRTVLAAIVLVTVLGLVDVAEARRVARVDRRDGVILLVTFFATLGLGIEPGLAVGIGANLLAHVVGGMQPSLVTLGRVPGTYEYRNVERQPGTTAEDGLILRLDGPLDFLSARTFGTRMRQMVAARPELRWIVLNCAAITRLDSTGLHALQELREQTAAAEIELRFATMRWQLREVVVRAGLEDELLSGVSFGTIGEALRSIGLPREHPLCAPADGEARPEVWY